MVEEKPGPPAWPPAPYDRDNWPVKTWLRFEVRNPEHGRPSRLASHAGVPFIAEVPFDAVSDEKLIQIVAFEYLRSLNTMVRREDARGLDLPKGWAAALDPNNPTRPNELRWLPIWPELRFEDGGDDQKDIPNPTLASWNLSRNPGHTLPASIVLVAAEVYTEDPPRISHGFGVRVPMRIEKTEAGLQITIRSFSAELPRSGDVSITDFAASLRSEQQNIFRKQLDGYIEEVITADYALEATATSALIDTSAYLIDELRFAAGRTEENTPEFQIKTVGKARTSARLPRQDSVHVVSTFGIDFGPDGIGSGGSSELRQKDSETEPLVTHAAPGHAEVFKKPPPDWYDTANPVDGYDYSMRRPERIDDILEIYRTDEVVRTPVPRSGRVKLEGPGFRIRLCPEIVKADRDQPGPVKTVPLPGGNVPVPRRDDFSAISAFANSRLFFDMLQSFGIDPTTFAVRAQRDVQVFYRSGIQPGGGGDGRTINAQVKFNCKDSNTLPEIDMRLALAELTRWDRDLTLPREKRWAEPLSIGLSGRWILHEYGHYMLAARIGQLEFDFAHSAGDAMAAVYFDPISRLADTRGGVSENFRGYTYPFVFATRRHDRNTLMGWAWYGTLNRSALAAEHGACDHNKAYLTEQILSTTIFRLYLALGGDSMRGDAPDRYTRGRASHMTLFLLTKAIESFASPPSTAEALEQAIEDVGLDMTAPLLIDAGPDEWQPALTHKVVRWAFEAQGMFPADPAKVLNGPGEPPPVDVYVRNRRPLAETTDAGTIEYGPGAYVPVSLDWGDDALWQLDPNHQIEMGNRGTAPARNITVRAWIGQATGKPSNKGWALGDRITWTLALGERSIRPIAGHSSRTFKTLTDAIKPLKTSCDFDVVLIEVSCPDDPANTDPAAALPSAVADGPAGLANLPTIPRQLTDLVACDNNLGLVVLR